MTYTYQLDQIHRIEVQKHGEGDYREQYFEMMGGRWVALGPETRWSSLIEIRYEYGLDSSMMVD